MQSRIGFGLVGLDHWYSAVPFAEAVAAHPEAELIAIADSRSERTRELAARCGAESVADVETLLDDPRVDAVASFVSADQNPSVCIRAAERGKHVVANKPLARTLAEATAVVEAVERAGVALVGAESRPRATAYGRRLWELVARIGPVSSASLTFAGRLPQEWPDRQDPGWWADPARTPGGAWIDHAIYQVDRMRWLLAAEAESIAGRTARLRYPELQVEDYGQAIVSFTGGAVTTLEDTWTAAPGTAATCLRIDGAEGAVIADSLTGTLATCTPSTRGDWVREELPDEDVSAVGPIIELVRGQETVLGGVRDAWANLALCLAFYEAAQQGCLTTPQRLDGVLA